MISDDDPQREPDGVPHDIVGLVAVSTCLAAAIVLALLLLGTWGKVAAIAVGLAAAPLINASLRRRDLRERDGNHPSR